MAEVDIKKVTKIYPGNVKAVKEIDLHVKDREFMVLVGPSGCGKSTTLRMVAGLEEISAGECYIGDRKVNDVPPKDRDIAMVFQNYALYPHMSVFDNMGFGLKLRKFKRSDIKERVNQAARILGLEDLLDRRPKALSGGQRQRVAMGRAIVREPAVFLFDEPLSNLDAKMRVEMRREIMHLHKTINTTMIYVTHDQVEAMTLGDRICVMRDGIIEQLGVPEIVFEYPASLFVARFIGTPPMNIFKGSLKSEGDNIIFDAGDFQLPMPSEKHAAIRDLVGKPSYFGLRPRGWVLKEKAERSIQDVSVKAKIDVKEMLGEEVLVHMYVGDHKFIVSVDPHSQPLLNDDIEVCPLMGRSHIFDGETEKNVTLPDFVKKGE